MDTMAEKLEKIVKAVLVGVCVVAIVMVGFAAHFRELSNLSALDMAQVARNLAAGRGYVTSTPTPMSLAIVPRAEGHPELSRPPAYIATLAGAVRLFGATDRVVALTATLFLLLCAAATYLLAARLFGRRAGVISLFLLISMPSVLTVATSGTDAMFMAMIVTVLFIVLAAWRTSGGEKDTGFALAAGAICGIAWLTRYEMLVLLILVLVFAAAHRRRRALRPMALSVLVFAVIVTPWLWRSYQLTGTPIASLRGYDLVMQTGFRPDTTAHLNFSAPRMHPVREALTQPIPMARKLARGLLEYYENTPRMFNAYLLAFFIVGTPLAIARRRHALLHLSVVLGFAFIAIALSLYGQINTVIMSLVPVTTVFAVGWMVQVVDEFVDVFCPYDLEGDCPPDLIDHWRARWCAVSLIAVTLFLVIPLGPFLFRETPPHSPPHAATPVSYLSETVAHRPERVLVSDMPSGVAWHTDRVAIPLPEGSEDLLRMREAGVEIEALHLSPEALRMPPSRRMRPWFEWLGGDDPPVEMVDDEQVAGIIWRLAP